MSNFKIKIDDFEFKLISKSLITEEIIYHKVQISSVNLNTTEETVFFAYISQSGTIWRLCSKYDNGSILKYDNYIQATILDFRLQAFIFTHYDSLPVYSQTEITCVYTPEAIKEFHNEISSRGTEFEDLLYIINETNIKNIFDGFIKAVSVKNANTTNYTSKSFYEKYGMPEIRMYKSMVLDVVNNILLGDEKKYEQYKKQNKYEDVPVTTYEDVPVTTYQGLSANISFNFDKNWFNDNNQIELQDYLKRHFVIIDKSNNPIELGSSSIPKELIMEYQLDFNFGKFKNKYFGIKLRHKKNNNIIVVHIGKIILDVKAEPLFQHDLTQFSGYHICNIVDENVKITKFGLYQRYYTEPDYTEMSGRGNFVTNFINKYITKPLEYSDQINYEYCMGQLIFSSRYNFMCACNEEKYLIKELLDEENKTFKVKYLKYKQKYISLKNKLSKTI